MQLTTSSNPRSSSFLRQGLAAATCALLGSFAGSARATEVDSGVLVYSEPDRVTGVESVVQVSKELQNGQSVGLKLVFDSLTGASANGATPSSGVQTFTRPSGRGAYTVSPGATPLDDTFKDTRFAGSGTWKRPWGRFTSTTLGANVSTEIDYLSLGFSGNVSRELFLKNTVVNAGFAIARDRINPQGGTPTPFSSMLPATGETDDDLARYGESASLGSRSLSSAAFSGAASGGTLREDEGGKMGGAENKTVADLLFGVSQVLGRATVAQVNYSFSHVSGYQTDPYKILSLLDGPTGAAPGEPIDYVYEQRPDARTKQSVYGELKHRLSHDVANLSYRYFWDDWSVRSQTIELRYAHALGAHWELKPHLRYYHQDQADFYRRFLVSGTPTPAFASADYRLGTFDATTYGLGIGHRFENGQRVTVEGEYYLQQGDKHPGDAYGSLVGLNLFPDVDAFMFRVGYAASFDW